MSSLATIVVLLVGLAVFGWLCDRGADAELAYLQKIGDDLEIPAVDAVKRT